MKAMTSDLKRQNPKQTQPRGAKGIKYRDISMQQIHGLHLWRADSRNGSSHQAFPLSMNRREVIAEHRTNTHGDYEQFITCNNIPFLQLSSIPVRSHPSYRVGDSSLESQIQKIRECENLPSETLPLERKKEIVRLACDAFPFVVANRQNHLRSLKRACTNPRAESDADLMEKAAWSSISTTDSDTGYRFTIGFRNIGCAYWRENPFHIGCFNCGYCSGIIPGIEPTQDELEAQFENALEQALETKVDFDVVEFLNDGSFFNDEEFSPSFRRHLFRRVNSLPYVKRVLVETRPEYINEQKVSDVLSELSHDKKLEVAIGLESADEFIRSVCIRKGFTCSDFEEAIKCLSSLGGRISVLAYSLVKPGFLSEQEAIEDQISTARYLAGLSELYGCNITIKLEPAVVAKGTLLDFLYFNGQETINQTYSVMSYWTIVEILCRIRQENIHLPVRIGSRSDMDLIEKVPALYDSNGMFGKWDFVVYEAVQLFNMHGSLDRLLAQIEGAFADKNFMDWKKRLGFRTTAIEECRKKYTQEIKQVKEETSECSRQAFFSQVFAALDRIECGDKGMRLARNLACGRGSRSADEIKTEVQEYIVGEFWQVAKDVSLKVLDVYFEMDRRRLMRVCLQVKNTREKDALYSIWVGIPVRTMCGTIHQEGRLESEQVLTQLPLAI